MIFTIEELKRRIEPIAKKYNLFSVYLFGSYARNEATEGSDVDILIDRTGSTIRGMFDMGGLYNDLRTSIGKDIDVVTTQTLEQNSTKQRTPMFIKNIMDERVKIYEQSGLSTTYAYSMDEKIIWETAINDIPRLLDFCNNELESK